jgi:LacI family transcriptional regulator
MTALVCGNDLIATGAYQAARELGLSVPGDLSITGFNDLPMMDLLAPPMTTVRVDYHALGRRAAELLLSQLEGQAGPPPGMELRPAELVVRGSTAPPRLPTLADGGTAS